MKYILSPHIALRSWLLVPYAYYVKGIRNAIGLKKEEYEFLSKCDGVQELEQNTALEEAFLKRDMIVPAATGAFLTDWQKPRFCYNRYFPAANWCITGKCNYNCIHCFMAADNAPKMTEFSSEEWQKTLSELYTCGVQTITLTGGEPMLHPDFMKIVEEICRRGMSLAEVTTNGSFITREKLRQIKQWGASPLFKISFDCIGFHDWMRCKKGAEEIAFNAIRICHEEGFKVRVQTNVNRINKDALLETAVKMSELGVEQMRVIRTTEAPRWAENAGKDACLELSEYFDLMLDFSEKYLETDSQMELDLWQFFQVFPKYRSFHYRPVQGGCHTFRPSAPVCRGNRAMIAINSNGDLVPCLQMAGYFDKHNTHLGNCKESGLQPLLREGKYLDAVTCSIDKMLEQNEKCKRCPYLKLCAGGCRALGILTGGGYLAPDLSKCIYFEKGYMEKTDRMLMRIYQKTGKRFVSSDDIKEE